MSAPAGPHAPKPLVLVGGAALFIAVATDFTAVIGRHVSHALLGSIEIVQAAVLIASTIAILVATIERRHAVVHLLVERMGDRARLMWSRVGSLLGLGLILAWFAGSAWLAVDLWHGFEESELLRIPYHWLRIFQLAGLLATALVFARQAVERRK